jgi:orotate phosphoribosyltransferase
MSLDAVNAGRRTAAARASGRTTVRTRLLDLLVKYSYRHDASMPFRLASGKPSAYYVDCKATTMRGEAGDLIGAAFAELLPAGVQAVGGLTMGSDPIALAVAGYCARHGRPLNAFSVRKEAKRHGLRKWIEGAVESGAAVAVIDDVVTTGGSTIDAIRKCRDEGLRIEAVIALVDRQEENGLDNIATVAGPRVPVTAILTLRELAEHAAAQRDPRGSAHA